MINSTQLLPAIAAVLCLTVSYADAQFQVGGRRRGNAERNREAIAHGWQLDYAAGQTAAQRTDKPMMVVLRCVP